MYGSDDGGEIVHTEDPLMCSLMQEAAAHIGIKGHVVGSTIKGFLYGYVYHLHVTKLHYLTHRYF